MRTSETIALAYFLYIFLLALTQRLPGGRRRHAATRSGAMVLLILVYAALERSNAAGGTRNWAPLIYILVGYWCSGLLYTAPMPWAERWLGGFDERWCRRTGLLRRIASAPRWLLEYLELVYLGCFLFLPAGYIALASAGHSASADRFWALVMIGELGSFAVLPWVQTRPPWAVEDTTALDQRRLMFRKWNALSIRSVSIQVNTFPSGHAAGAFATAIGVATVLPAIGAVFLFLALCITFAAVVGRYHYALDALYGIGLTLAGWGVVSWLRL